MLPGLMKQHMERERNAERRALWKAINTELRRLEPYQRRNLGQASAKLAELSTRESVEVLGQRILVLGLATFVLTVSTGPLVSSAVGLGWLPGFLASGWVFVIVLGWQVRQRARVSLAASLAEAVNASEVAAESDPFAVMHLAGFKIQAIERTEGVRGAVRVHDWSVKIESVGDPGVSIARTGFTVEQALRNALVAAGVRSAV